MPRATVIVVGGTAGTGKTTIGEALASRIEAPYLEGDKIHPQANVEKMANGIPLTDSDRWQWLERISTRSSEAAKQSSLNTAVVSCSALKKVYRDLIAKTSPDTDFFFVFLYASKNELVQRTEKRENHFMKSAMLDSQFADLQLPKPDEEPTAVVINVSGKSVELVLDEAYNAIKNDAKQ